MKKLLVLLSAAMISLFAIADGGDNLFSRFIKTANAKHTSHTADPQLHKQDSIYEVVKRLYSKGKISADSVISLAVYHKTWKPDLAQRCLNLVVSSDNPRALMELGALYAFSPEFAAKHSEGVRLLETAAKSGLNEASEYLGLYFYNKNDVRKAAMYLGTRHPLSFGFSHAALGGMYLTGRGMEKNLPKARDMFRQSALKGYARGMSLYGHNLRAAGGGKIDFPEAFYWLYMAGDLGDDAARTTLHLPRINENLGDTATAALGWIEAVNKVKNFKNDPLYKEGFLPSLKAREKAADLGDDWARFYLGSMNYNGDFLNQNYKQVLKYYEPLALNGKMPRTVLAIVNQRLSDIYRYGKGVKADPAKAAQYARQAARYGSLKAYKIVEGLR